jgi:hypothetical protein
MVQLLLALSKEPQEITKFSPFATRLLKTRADKCVLPSKVDYMQSDCQKIDRDKSQKEFYTSFGTTSFENLALSQSF